MGLADLREGSPHSRPVPREDLAGCGCELAVTVAEHELDPTSILTEIYEQVTGLLGRPRACGWGGHAQDVHGLSLVCRDSVQQVAVLADIVAVANSQHPDKEAV